MKIVILNMRDNNVYIHSVPRIFQKDDTKTIMQFFGYNEDDCYALVPKEIVNGTTEDIKRNTTHRITTA